MVRPTKTSKLSIFVCKNKQEANIAGIQQQVYKKKTSIDNRYTVMYFFDVYNVYMFSF